MAPSPNLVNATALQRLAAKALDALPSVALCLAPALLFALAGGQDAVGLGMGTGAVLAGAYVLWLWIWEAGSGKTPGNLALGIRTVGTGGHAPGMAAVLLRNVLVALSGAVVVGPVVVVVSNLWDRNHQRQGWHDKLANTLVVDVKAGRNPLLTGGILGGADTSADAAAAPALTGVPATTATAPPAASGPVNAVPGFPAAGFSAAGFTASPAGSSPIQTVPAAAQRPVAPAPGFTSAPQAYPAPAAAPAAPLPAHPDDELEMTQVASRRRATGVKVQFDDGAAVVVSDTALLGRNPAPKPQETVGQLLDFADMGRSVSKTHLHLQADPNGIWVTDRSSTNGSAVVTAQGLREELEPLRPVLAPIGSTVFFGDRSFTVSRA